MTIEPSWFDRGEDYLSAVFGFWQSRVAVVLMIERLVERAYPIFWERHINPWFTPERRRKFVLWLALVAFAWGNFRAFDEERRAKESVLSQVSGGPILVGVRFTANRIASTYSEYPFGLQVVIQTDKPTKATFAIVCNGPIGKGHARFIGITATVGAAGILKDNPNVFTLYYELPEFLPETPLVAYLYSKEAIQVTELAGP